MSGLSGKQTSRMAHTWPKRTQPRTEPRTHLPDLPKPFSSSYPSPEASYRSLPLSYSAHSSLTLDSSPIVNRRYMCAWLAAQRDTAEASLAGEVEACEEEHELHVAALRTQALADVQVLEAVRAAEMQKAREEAGGLSGEYHQLQRDHESAMAQMAKLEERVSYLVEENAR